jgi:hypothetical protein
MNNVDPNLFYLDFGRVSEVLLTLLIFAMLIERALALVFENRFVIEKLLYVVERAPGSDPTEGKADSSLNAPIGSRNVVSVRSKNRSLKEIVTMIVAFAVCYHWDFDVFSILMPVSHKAMTVFGIFLTAMIVAGGSKAAVKLFKDWMDIKSSAQREIDEFKQPKKP